MTVSTAGLESERGVQAPWWNGSGRAIAWLPVPLFLILTAALWGVQPKEQWGNPVLLIFLNVVFSALTSLVVAFLMARSFLIRGSPGLLLVGCGVLTWGLTAVVSVIIDPHDVNTNVTIYNLGSWLAAFCHLTGSLVSLRSAAAWTRRGLKLTTAYGIAAIALGAVAFAAYHNRIPVFFVQGTGGTRIRAAVLVTAIAMFLLTAFLLRLANRRSVPAFVHFYIIAMVLIALGLSGVLIQSAFGSRLNWTARAAQYCGGIYILAAAVISVRESRQWEVSLADELVEVKQRYDDLFEIAADGIMVVEISADRSDGHLVQANQAMQQMLGVGADEVLWLKLSGIVAPKDLVQLLKQARSGDSVIRREITLLARDYRRIPTEVTVRLFRSRGTPMALFVVRDVAERKESERQIRELAMRLTYHVDNSPLAVIEWGPDMRLTRWSAEAERLFGWTADEVIGKRVGDFRWVYADDLEQVRRVSTELKTGSVRVFSANRNYRKDGSVVHCEWYNSSLSDENGELISILSLVLDVTGRREAERNLRRLNEDLEQFAFATSHDLQESLRNVTVFSELLHQRHGSALDDQGRDYLGHIRSGARRTLNLLSGLRSYLQASSQPKSISALTDGNACLKEVITNLQESINAQQAVISADQLPLLPVHQVHFLQLLQNLISNALKFHSDAPPEIRLSAVRSGNRWTFSIRDNGIGIGSQYHSQVFGVFKRLHGQDLYEGTGIGLSLCQKIVEGYGGKIWVESELGQGSTFCFTLPAAD